MLKRTGILVLATIVFCSMLLSGCGGSKSGSKAAITPAEPRGNTGTIKTGKSVQAGSLEIDPQGGTLKVENADSPINGLELTVPSGSYAAATQFSISYAPIEKQTFGEDFNALTPLIKIDNGGTYAEEIMAVKIPVEVPADSFAMGFLYDEETRTLEGLPLLAQDATSITVGTRHFSDFLISMIPLAKLKKDIDSHFRPGIDDWQFVNRGSYIEPGGHCAGQSLTALWYYVNQPDGQDLTLYNRYDNNGNDPDTPDLWQDDSYGYRLASTIQKDINWSSFENKFWTDLAGVNDQATWNLFAYSMQLTGEPQEVGIFSQAGGGHDMICYRILDNKLYIADPNYPGNTERRIEFTNNQFVPYNSGANEEEIAAGHGKAYEKIEYCAKTTTINWNVIGQRWTEFKNGTIGNDRFPAYKVVYKDENGQYQELKDGYVSASNLIDIALDASFPGTMTVVRDGKALNFDANGNYELKPGNNQLGAYIVGILNQRTPQEKKKYIDFQYFNVVYSGLTLNPPTQEMQPDIRKSFGLTLMEGAPEGSHFEWYVDGVLKQSGYNFSISVSFPDEGQHTVICKIVDANGKVLQQAQGIAIVKAPATTTFVANNLPALQAMQYMKLAIKGKWSFNSWTASGDTTKDKSFTFEIPWYPTPEDPDIEISWSGTSFSGKKTTGKGSNSSSGEVEGTVSSDGKTLTNLEWIYQSFSDNGTGESPWKTETTTTIKLKDIPIPRLVSERATRDKFTVNFSGEEVEKYVSEISYHTVTYRNGEKESEATSVEDSIQWDAADLQGMPALNVSFQVDRAYYPGG